MRIGDLVTRKSHGNDITFCIIGFRAGPDGECVAVLKALYNQIMIVDSPVEDLVNILTEGKL